MPKNGPYYEVGRYVCRLGQHAMVEKEKGPQLVLRFKVLGRYDNMGQVHEVNSYERTYYRVFNENTISFAIEDLKALGFAAPKFSSLDPEDSDPFNFDGIECDMWCSHKPNRDGDMQEVWSPAKQGGSTEIEGKRVEKSALRKLDNLFGRQLRSEVAPTGKPQPVAASQGISDEDVPF